MPGARWALRAPSRGRPSSPRSIHRVLRLTQVYLALDLFALVADVLRLGETQLDLGATALEIDLQRHERVAPDRQLARELLDLVPMGQQLARPLWLVGERRR